ncbi:MAG: hypothetical protein N2C14_13580, partial [Planctomycetales bacterium]
MNVRRQDALYDLLVFSQQRAADAVKDGAWDVDFCYQAAGSFERQAGMIPNQPPPPPSPSLRDECHLIASVKKEDDQVFVQMQGRGEGKRKLWLVADYDPSLLSVAAEQGPPHYENDLSADPDLRAKPPSLTLEDQISETLRLRVNPVGRSNKPAELTFRFYDETRLHLQKKIEIELPSPDPFALAINGEKQDGTWASHRGIMRLTPFPNHVTGFQLALKNLSKRATKVKVELLSLPEDDAHLFDPERGLPLGAETIAVVPETSLPEGMELVPIAFSGIGGGPAPASSDAGENPESQPKNRAAKAVPLSSELAIVVTDLDNSLQWGRRIQVRPLRPKSYLQAPTAVYNM